MLSQKLRIYPSKLTEQKLCEHLDLCKWLYNRLLEELNMAKSQKRRIGQKETQHLIVELKKTEPRTWQCVFQSFADGQLPTVE